MVDFLKEQAESLVEAAKFLEDKADQAVEYLSGILSDDPPKENEEAVQHRRYRYNHDSVVGPWPILETRDKGFPKDKLPRPEWFLKVVKVAVGIAVNRLAWQADGSRASAVHYDKVEIDLRHIGLGKMNCMAATVDDETIESFGLAEMKENDRSMAELQLIANTLLKRRVFDPLDVLATIEQGVENNPKGRPKTLDEYKSLFVTLPLPDISKNYDSDFIFADLRVAGFNPVVIKRISKLPDRFPVTDTMLSDATGKGDTLSVAAREDRLFLADYSALNGATMGNYPAGPKYVFAPLALFALPPAKHSRTRKLLPVAIQCGQDPEEFRVYTPAQGTLWSRAKATVQQADSSYHELVSHLSGCHLLMEPFAIATHNELNHDNHPIGHLLTPHFEGTLFINDGAVNSLLSPTAQVSQVLGSAIESSHKIAVDALLEDNYFNKHMLPTELEERGVMSEDLYYPYRDDALELWHAIQDWVRNYVGIFYKDDASVQNDIALQAWAKQVVAEEGGRVRGFGEKDAAGMLVSGQLTTVKYLVEALTMIIFTASASHATFNFAQLQMTFAPAVPGAIYRSMPVTRRQAFIMPELDHLPPLELSRVQMEFLMMLGGVQHTRLGDYGDGWPPNDDVRNALVKFQEQLERVSEIITDRNKSRKHKYTLLLPENIPQSINI